MIGVNVRRRAVVSFGIRFGYWPCESSLFLQLNIWKHYIAIWRQK